MLKSFLNWLRFKRCMYLHRFFTYSLPTAGRNLTWDCECICGCKFVVTKPNTPRWVSPIWCDMTKPATWTEWEKLNPMS